MTLTPNTTALPVDWCAARNMNLTAEHLQSMVSVIDTTGTGVVHFWAWLAIQSYLFLNLRAQNFDFQHWLAYCSQTEVSGGTQM